MKRKIFYKDAHCEVKSWAKKENWKPESIFSGQYHGWGLNVNQGALESTTSHRLLNAKLV